MKYVDIELYERACDPFIDDEESNKKLQDGFKKRFEEFCKISNRFPKAFVKIFKETALHDFEIKELYLKMGKNNVDIHFKLLDWYDHKTLYDLVFTKISNFRSDMDFGVRRASSLSCDILVCEILPAEKGRTSIEMLSDFGTVYMEFEKLKFSK